MSLREIDYKAEMLFELRGHMPRVPFACVDPGVHGAVVVYKTHGLDADGNIGVPDLIYPLAAGLSRIGWDLLEAGVRLIVMESQHIGANNFTGLKLARGAAKLPAFVAGAHMARTSPIQATKDPVTCMWIHPATWQSPLARRAGVSLRAKKGEPKPKKGLGKDLAKKFAEEVIGEDGRYRGATKAQREGMCDATAMAMWVQTTLYLPHEVRLPIDQVRHVGFRDR